MAGNLLLRGACHTQERRLALALQCGGPPRGELSGGKWIALGAVSGDVCRCEACLLALGARHLSSEHLRPGSPGFRLCLAA